MPLTNPASSGLLDVLSSSDDDSDMEAEQRIIYTSIWLNSSGTGIAPKFPSAVDPVVG